VGPAAVYLRCSTDGQTEASMPARRDGLGKMGVLLAYDPYTWYTLVGRDREDDVMDEQNHSPWPIVFLTVAALGNLPGGRKLDPFIRPDDILERKPEHRLEVDAIQLQTAVASASVSTLSSAQVGFRDSVDSH